MALGSKTSLEKEYAASEGRKNTLGYAISALISVGLKLGADAAGLVADEIYDILILPVALALGGLIGETINTRLLESRVYGKRNREFRQQIEFINEKYAEIRRSLETQLAQLKTQLVMLGPDDPARERLAKEIAAVEAAMARERELEREEIRGVTV